MYLNVFGLICLVNSSPAVIIISLFGFTNKISGAGVTIILNGSINI